MTIFVKNSNLNLWEGSEYVSAFKYVKILNIYKFFLIRHGSEYAPGCNYGMVLNIPGFWVYQVSVYASVAQSFEYVWIWLNNALWQVSEYTWSTFHRVLNEPLILNVLGLGIRLGWKYAGVTHGAEYAWISLSIPQYAWIYLNNTEYDWISWHIPEKTECWTC